MTGSGEFGYGDEEEIVWIEDEASRARVCARSNEEAGYDYYKHVQMEMPKREIGEDVAGHGIPVPLIRSVEEWQEAFDEGVAMVRSEMPQDYNGLSGLLGSCVLRPERLERPLYSFGLEPVSPSFNRQLGKLVAASLRSGELPINRYMELFVWPLFGELGREAAEFGAQLPKDYYYSRQASHWRYVPGINLRVFRDPTVDGRYHLATKPSESYVLGWQIDTPEHSRSLKLEGADHEVPVAQVIEFYEAVRGLPRFDTRQAPLLEMQLDKEGVLHFLQYLKTGHIVQPIEPFELPPGDNLVRATNVRGATDPAGEDIRIYIAPKKITERMRGQGVYIDTFHMPEFAQQLMSMIGKVIINNAYVSLKDNHFNSAPLYRPQVAIGLGRNDGRVSFGQLTALVHGETLWDTVPNRTVYINATVTANGREATIKTDWQPHFED